jgi:hypothetical protein
MGACCPGTVFFFQLLDMQLTELDKIYISILIPQVIPQRFRIKEVELLAKFADNLAVAFS